MAWLIKLWKPVVDLAILALPMLDATRPSGLSRVFRWLLHVLLVAAILAGLGYLNYTLDLERALRSPWPELHKAWLPLLFSLFYLLCWLGLWLGRWLLSLERPAKEFPDIDDAWAEATAALRQAGIGIDEVPLFLFLGRPASGEASFFQAAGIPLLVPRTPERLDAPLHIFANEEAAFITCAETSLVGRHSKSPTGVADPAGASPKTASLAPVQAILARAREQGRGPGQLTEQEKREISAVVVPESGLAPAPANNSPIDKVTLRLQYLCRLVARARHPYCPINGLVLLIPWTATTAEAEAGRVANLAQRDVQAVHEALQIDCPYFVIACDLENAPGFHEFIEQIPAAERLRPLGRRFPLMPDVDPHEIHEVMKRGIVDLGRQIVNDTICQRFRTEVISDASPDMPAAVRANFRLYQFLAHLRKGFGNLGQVLYRGTQTELSAPPMIAGCYLAATGVDAHRDQAFIADIFQEFLRNQNFVAWSPRALAVEANYRRRTRLVRLGLLALILILAAGGYVAG